MKTNRIGANAECSNSLKVNYRPKLYIDMEPLENEILKEKIYTEIDKGSITPTTLKSRNFLSDETKYFFSKGEEVFSKKMEILNENCNKFKNLVPQSTTEKLKILSEGIMEEGEFAKFDKEALELSRKFEFKIVEFDKFLTELKKCKSSIKECANLPLFYQDIYSSNSSTSVNRYGINVTEELLIVAKEYNKDLEKCNVESPKAENKIDKSKSPESKKKSQQSDKHTVPDITLHPIEVYLVQTAIRHLLTKDNTVLVDIFARDKSGLIKVIKKSNDPEIHTIVLYRNNDKEFVVIDPSNSDFSKHLGGSFVKQLINVAFKEPVDIVVPTRNLKIYQPPEGANEKKLIGPDPYQYRDCIDIAVKIAFGLNGSKKKINIKNIDSLDIVKEITNQRGMDKYLPDLENNPLRIKQASSDLIRTDFRNWSIKVENQIKSLFDYNEEPNSEEYKKMAENQLQALSDMSGVHETIIQNLKENYNKNALTFISYINKLNQSI